MGHCTAILGGLVVRLMQFLLFCSLLILNTSFETELNKTVEMTQDIKLLSLFSFPGEIPKLDAHFRLIHRFTIAESFWSRRKWCKIHYSLEKGWTFPSENYSSPCYVLASTTEARRSIQFCLLPSLELAASRAYQNPQISYFFSIVALLGFSSRGRWLLLCSWASHGNPILSVVFQSQSIPSSLFPFVSFSPQWLATHD